jgi:hypothetical protein
MGASRGRRAVAAILPRVRPRQPGARGQELAIVVVDAPGPAARPSSGSPSCGPPARRSARSGALRARNHSRARAPARPSRPAPTSGPAAASSATDSLRTSAASQPRNLPGAPAARRAPPHTVASPCCRRASPTISATNSATEADHDLGLRPARPPSCPRAVLEALGLEHQRREALGVDGRGPVVDGDRVEHQALAEPRDREGALDPRVLALDRVDALD